MFGKLTLSTVPFDQPIPLVSGDAVVLLVIAVRAWVVIKGHLPYLWNEWIISVDHKRIGVMYMFLAMPMLLRGFANTLMMRVQQAVALHSDGFLPEHYNQVFSAHSTGDPWDGRSAAPDCKDVEMPGSSPTGFVSAFFATIMGFAMIWQIWWMVILGLIGAFATFVAFARRDHVEYVIPAAEVGRIDQANIEERRGLVIIAGGA